jgi:hypothetical protein
MDKENKKMNRNKAIDAIAQDPMGIDSTKASSTQ